MWPVPSNKEWSGICTVAIRAVAVLGWVHRRNAERTQLDSSAAGSLAEEEQEQHLLMQALLQLLDRLLTGMLLCPAALVSEFERFCCMCKLWSKAT